LDNPGYFRVFGEDEFIRAGAGKAYNRLGTSHLGDSRE
jgi:hypothetical protein